MQEFICDYSMKVSIFKLERCDEPPYSSEHDLIVLLGPHSKNLLLRKYFFRDIGNKCKNNCVIIPSSYDDTAVYKILEREYGMKIVWSTYVHKELVVINSLHRDYSKYIQYYLQNKSLKRIIVFIEASPKLKKDLFYQNTDILDKLIVFHGVWGSPGVIIDDAIKVSASLNYDHQVLIDYERRSLYMRICSSRNNFVMKLYFSQGLI